MEKAQQWFYGTWTSSTLWGSEGIIKTSLKPKVQEVFNVTYITAGWTCGSFVLSFLSFTSSGIIFRIFNGKKERMSQYLHIITFHWQLAFPSFNTNPRRADRQSYKQPELQLRCSQACCDLIYNFFKLFALWSADFCKFPLMNWFLTSLSLLMAPLSVCRCPGATRAQTARTPPLAETSCRNSPEFTEALETWQWITDVAVLFLRACCVCALGCKDAAEDFLNWIETQFAPSKHFKLRSSCVRWRVVFWIKTGFI